MGRIRELVRRVGEANRKPVGNSSFNGHGLYCVTDPALTRAGRRRVSCVLLALALIMLVVLICLVLH